MSTCVENILSVNLCKNILSVNLCKNILSVNLCKNILNVNLCKNILSVNPIKFLKVSICVKNKTKSPLQNKMLSRSLKERVQFLKIFPPLLSTSSFLLVFFYFFLTLALSYLHFSPSFLCLVLIPLLYFTFKFKCYI